MGDALGFRGEDACQQVGLIAADNWLRACRTCLEEKSISEFNTKSCNKDGMNTQCARCELDYNNKHKRDNYTEDHKRKKRCQRLRYKYGITADQFDEMLDEQGGGCLVCGSGPDAAVMHVDHCHRRGKVRGILCSQCNQSLGLLSENAGRMRALASYIEEYNERF